MDFKDLKYFYDAVKLSSLRKAAEKNFVSSSAISIAIRRLEESLNMELLEHKKNKFLPNQNGLNLAEEAKKLFEQIEDIKLKLNSPHDIAGKWTIGTQQSIAQKYFPEFLKEAKKRYPKLDIIVRTGTTDKNKEELNDETLDSAIMVSNVSLKEYEKITLKSGYFYIYGTDTKLDNFYLTEDTIECKKLIKSYRKKFGKEINISSRISSWGTNKLFAEAGLGLTYLPDYLESKKLKRKYADNKDFLFPYEIQFIGKPTKIQHPISIALLEILKKIIR